MVMPKLLSLFTLPVHVESWQGPKKRLFFFWQEVPFIISKEFKSAVQWLADCNFCRPGLKINTVLRSSPLCQQEEFKRSEKPQQRTRCSHLSWHFSGEVNNSCIIYVCYLTVTDVPDQIIVLTVEKLVWVRWNQTQQSTALTNLGLFQEFSQLWRCCSWPQPEALQC